MLVWAQVHHGMRKDAEGHKKYRKWTRADVPLKVTEAPNRSDATADRLDETGAGGAEKTKSWPPAALMNHHRFTCGSKSDRVLLFRGFGLTFPQLT